MMRSVVISAAVIAAAACQLQASFAREAQERRDAPRAASDCVRAPNVGAFAGAPYDQPPCMPRTMGNR